jgi:uncharacterized protein YbjT (DUF2867 family)
MRVLVMGATGGSGRAAVEELVADGHEVTAFARRTAEFPAGVRTAIGDATVASDVDRAVRGQDAVVVTLGITESPVRVRLRGSAGTPMDVRSHGTENVVNAMRAHGVRRLVVQSSYGVGPTRNRLPLSNRVVFALLLRPQIDDTERQEHVVRNSGLDFTLVQPVTLTDGDEPAIWSTDADPAGLQAQGMRVSRRALGRVLADAVADPGLVGRTLAVSGAPAPTSTPEPVGR